jgi:hypothetical protein
MTGGDKNQQGISKTKPQSRDLFLSIGEALKKAKIQV